MRKSYIKIVFMDLLLIQVQNCIGICIYAVYVYRSDIY